MASFSWTQRNSASLLDLPAEIHAILHKALFAGFKFEVCIHLPHDIVLRRSTSLALLSACRLIHNEAVPYLSAQSTVWHQLWHVYAQSTDSILPAKYLHNLKLAVKLCHLSIVALGRLGGLPALKTLEVVDPSVYQFLRPGQYPDTDIVPSDSEVVRLFSLNRSNLDNDLAYCSDTEGRRAR